MEQEIPKATHEGETIILGVRLKTYRLDDGRTIIDADDLKKLLEKMANGNPLETSN